MPVSAVKRVRSVWPPPDWLTAHFE